jgi:hypothetical protein
VGQFAVPFDTLFRRYADIQLPCMTKPLKEGPMSNPETYPRQTAYGSAILGTNNSKLIERIADARKAIEHRLSNLSKSTVANIWRFERLGRDLWHSRASELTGQFEFSERPVGPVSIVLQRIECVG